MSWRYTNEELSDMSRGQYQSLQDNPWKETRIDNIFLSNENSNHFIDRQEIIINRTNSIIFDIIKN